ncbi:hypothetical protein ANCDUO_12103 [Ancylostoma duodenale]|uniref:Uncharacterized protein n=1 Tax=Ancylostoma duodenale TaxID=51022 RepID=A0A0C2D6F6_9BILA|nr:hypothetical protein ANCDUO_12103 [Ancylostoma duodenale]
MGPYKYPSRPLSRSPLSATSTSKTCICWSPTCGANEPPKSYLRGEGVMELLLEKRTPLAPLMTMFQTHLERDDFPNRPLSESSLVSGTTAAQRHFLLENFPAPNREVSFVFVDKAGTYIQANHRLVPPNRCRHGQFLLGVVTALQKLSYWGPLLQWANERGVIASPSTLRDLFD